MRKLLSTHMKSSALAPTQPTGFLLRFSLILTFCGFPPNIHAQQPKEQLSENWIDKVEHFPVIDVIAYASESHDHFVTEQWNEELLSISPARSLDDILRGSTRYNSFRRTSSRVAHPTTQGVQLRNIGGNAASRSLVLLDGVPQNDPFGGWVYWNRYHPSTIEAITLTPGSRRVAVLWAGRLN